MWAAIPMFLVIAMLCDLATVALPQGEDVVMNNSWRVSERQLS